MHSVPKASSNCAARIRSPGTSPPPAQSEKHRDVSYARNQNSGTRRNVRLLKTGDVPEGVSRLPGNSALWRRFWKPGGIARREASLPDEPISRWKTKYSSPLSTVSGIRNAATMLAKCTPFWNVTSLIVHFVWICPCVWFWAHNKALFVSTSLV